MLCKNIRVLPQQFGELLQINENMLNENTFLLGSKRGQVQVLFCGLQKIKMMRRVKYLVCKVVALSTTNPTNASAQLYVPYYGRYSENSLAPFSFQTNFGLRLFRQISTKVTKVGMQSCSPFNYQPNKCVSSTLCGILPPL